MIDNFEWAGCITKSGVIVELLDVVSPCACYWCNGAHNLWRVRVIEEGKPYNVEREIWDYCLEPLTKFAIKMLGRE